MILCMVVYSLYKEIACFKFSGNLLFDIGNLGRFIEVSMFVFLEVD